MARSGHRGRRSAAPRPPAGRRARRAPPMPRPARSCTRCAAARWRRWARCPSRQYYGTVDATPLFVMLAGAYGERTGDWTLIARALARDRDGRWPGSTAPATWTATASSSTRAAPRPAFPTRAGRTSHDSVFHADGSLAEGPIALVEVQGYAYAARLAASICARALGLEDRADNAGAPGRAAARSVFEERFWCDEHRLLCHRARRQQGALPRAHEQSGTRVCGRASSVPSAAPIVASTLLDSDFFSGWGVRTVAKGEARYNPMSYHNGSIWPHDNALLARGLARVRRQERVSATSSRR